MSSFPGGLASCWRALGLFSLPSLYSCPCLSSGGGNVATPQWLTTLELFLCDELTASVVRIVVYCTLLTCVRVQVYEPDSMVELCLAWHCLHAIEYQALGGRYCRAPRWPMFYRWTVPPSHTIRHVTASLTCEVIGAGLSVPHIRDWSIAAVCVHIHVR